MTAPGNFFHLRLPGLGVSPRYPKNPSLALKGAALKIKPFVKKVIFKAIDYAQRRVTRYISRGNLLEYAPNGWKSVSDNSGWDSFTVVDAEKSNWQFFCQMLGGTGPIDFHHEQKDPQKTRSFLYNNVNITYGYVLAIAAHQKTSLSILDYGGSLGHYYNLGKALLPQVRLDFCCKETPVMAEAGKQVNPEIHWYTDDSYLDRIFDLVMVTGSLQYMEHWQTFLKEISRAVGEYFFLTRVPVIQETGTYVAIQKTHNTEMCHWIFNKDDLLQVMDSSGFLPVREFNLGERHYIHNATERCELRGWLFRKISDTVS